MCNAIGSVSNCTRDKATEERSAHETQKTLYPPQRGRWWFNLFFYFKYVSNYLIVVSLLFLTIFLGFSKPFSNTCWGNDNLKPYLAVRDDARHRNVASTENIIAERWNISIKLCLFFFFFRFVSVWLGSALLAYPYKQRVTMHACMRMIMSNFGLLFI